MPCERGSLVQASDGLPARCVGPWSRDKLYYIRRYLEIFSVAMRGKFSNLVYIDLFAGPGLCMVDDDSGEIQGSPLVALSVRHRFTEYHFVEADNRAMAALQERLIRSAPQTAVKYYSGDANVLIPELARNLPSSSLNVAVIDPTGLHLRFESLRLLTQGRKVDLIYLFPEFMDVKRNLERYLGQPQSPLDEVLGTDEWRSRARARLPEMGDEPWEEVTRPMVEILQSQLASLGYVKFDFRPQIIVRNRKNVPLYYLVYASKNPRGEEFWNKISKIGPTGQREMF